MAKKRPEDQEQPREDIVQSNYVLHPLENSKVIGKVTRLPTGAWRGVLFQRAVSIKALSGNGSALAVDTSSAILRQSARAAKWALSHAYKSRLTDQLNSDITIPNPT